MFVFSVKTSKKKLLSYIFVGMIFLCVLIVWLVSANKTHKNAADEAAAAGLTAQSNTARIEYLKTFGWEVSEEAVEVREVAIPQSFSEVYLNYNEIQKGQGFDLTQYKGKLCSRYGYTVKNYPDSNSSAGMEGVRANLLIYEGQIIGGDICSLKLDGFMHGFKLPGN